MKYIGAVPAACCASAGAGSSKESVAWPLGGLRRSFAHPADIQDGPIHQDRPVLYVGARGVGSKPRPEDGLVLAFAWGPRGIERAL